MSQNDKLLKRLLAQPNDFTYDELKKLLSSIGCSEDTKVKLPVQGLLLFIRRQELF